MWVSTGIVLGFVAWFILRYIVTSFYVVNQNERAVKTSFGRAQRRGHATTLESPLAATLLPDEHQRYCWPLLRVLGPGFHFKWPWERVYKVSIATATINMAQDLEEPTANQNGTILEAVTKDQLNALAVQLRDLKASGQTCCRPICATSACSSTPRRNRSLWRRSRHDLRL